VSEDRDPEPTDTDASEDASEEKGKSREKRKARAEGQAVGEPEVVRDRNRRIREEAASKRKSKRSGGGRTAVAAGLDAGEMVDDALARGTHNVTLWLKRNINVIQWVVVIGLAGGIGYQVYSVTRSKTDAKATDALFSGVVAENARVGEPAPGPDQRTGLEDTRPAVKDDAARLAAAVSAYRAAMGHDATKTVAQLALAGVLFDQGKFKEALAEYSAVRKSELVEKELDARGRSIEGIGLSEEALGNTDAAQKAFRELSNLESPGFAALGLFHQARLALKKGEKDPAKELLKNALKKLEKPKDSGADANALFGGSPPGYLEQSARELLSSIDPSAVPQRAGGITPEQIEQMTRQMDAKQAGGDSQLSKEKLGELLKQLSQKQPAAPASSTPPAGAPSGTP
jgi:predicted negative regulator of RcsB-dependent stress response